MGHEINLTNFTVRCDLISETIDNKEIKDINIETKKYKDIRIERLNVKEDKSKVLNKKAGIYTTIFFNDITDYENRNDVITVVAKELYEILKRKALLGKKVLIVGLGNELSTPDSLGPKTVKNIIVTRHLFNMEEIEVEEGYSNVSAFSPGVYAATGIESFDIIKGIVDVTKPDYIIAIDALASSSIENVNKIIQITDSGIEPGSGIGNNRKELSAKLLSIPVIVIGVPTVVDAVTIVNDTISFLVKKISYNIMNIDNPKCKLINPKNHNYLNINYSLDSQERKKYLGLLGELKEHEIKELLSEVLTPIGYNFIVTPKEVDFLIDKLAIIISKSINNVLHDGINKNN